RMVDALRRPRNARVARGGSAARAAFRLSAARRTRDAGAVESPLQQPHRIFTLVGAAPELVGERLVELHGDLVGGNHGEAEPNIRQLAAEPEWAEPEHRPALAAEELKRDVRERVLEQRDLDPHRLLL